MLQFVKNSIAFTVTDDGLVLISTKLIDNKGYRIMQGLDGTIGSLGVATNRLTALHNDDYKLFSEIQEANHAD